MVVEGPESDVGGLGDLLDTRPVAAPFGDQPDGGIDECPPSAGPPSVQACRFGARPWRRSLRHCRPSDSDLLDHRRASPSRPRRPTPTAGPLVLPPASKP